MKLADRLKRHADSRPGLRVKLSDIIGGDYEDAFVSLRPLTIGEQFEAVEAAVQYRKRLIASLPETHAKQLLDDDNFLGDVVEMEKIWRACRDADDPSQTAFPSSDWMRETFTVNEMVAFADFFGKALRDGSHVKTPLTEEQRVALVEACASASGSDLPDRCLATLTRPVLADLFVWLCDRHMRMVKPVESAA